MCLNIFSIQKGLSKLFCLNLLIDYDDRIVVNMKDEGKREVMRDIETSFSQDNVKVSEVMDFNNIEYVFCKN